MAYPGFVPIDFERYVLCKCRNNVICCRKEALCRSHYHDCICDLLEYSRIEYKCKGYEHNCTCYPTFSNSYKTECKSSSHDCICMLISIASDKKIEFDAMCNAKYHQCYCENMLFLEKTTIECKVEDHLCICLEISQKDEISEVCKSDEHSCVCHLKHVSKNFTCNSSKHHCDVENCNICAVPVK